MSLDNDSQNARKVIGVGTAILIGQLVVNIPVLFIIAFISAIGIIFTVFIGSIISIPIKWLFPIGMGLSIVAGVVFGWIWWSYSVPRWRKWALENGAQEDKLQKWGVITGLVWPKGSIFEKTEFKIEE